MIVNTILVSRLSKNVESDIRKELEKLKKRVDDLEIKLKTHHHHE